MKKSVFVKPKLIKLNKYQHENDLFFTKYAKTYV